LISFISIFIRIIFRVLILNDANPEVCVNLANFLIAGLIKAINTGGIDFELLRRLTGLSIDESATAYEKMGIAFPSGNSPKEIITNYGNWMKNNGLLEDLEITSDESGILSLKIRKCWLSGATDLVREDKTITEPLCMFLTTIAGRIEKITGKTIKIVSAGRDQKTNICSHEIQFE